MGAFADLQGAIDDVAEQKAGLDGEYERQRSEIEDAYELSETPEERAALDQLLERLDNQRDMAIEQLGRGYDQAREQILARQREATGAGQQELEQLASTFEATYAQIADAEQRAGQRSSLGGVPTGGTPDTGLQGASARANAGLAAAAQARNAITQEDIGWLSDMMLAQREAGIGDAQRTAMRVGGQVEGDHLRRVADRTNQERLLRADALQGLDARFDQRRDGLLGRHGDLVGQLEQMREQQRQFDAQLAEQRAARQAAASRASSAGESSSGGPTAGGLAVNEDGMSSLADLSRLGRVPSMLADRAGDRGRDAIIDRVVPDILRRQPSSSYRDVGPSSANQSTAGTRFYN